MRFGNFICCFLTMISLFSFAGCGENPIPIINDDKTINVSIHTDNHCSVIGESFVTINKNEDLFFELLFDEGYRFGDSSYGTYNEDTHLLTILDIQIPIDVFVSSKEDGNLHIELLNDDTLGSVEIFPKHAGYDAGDVIMIRTTPLNGNRFLCYSYAKECRQNGNELVGNILCYDVEYSFKITNDITIAVNYFSTKGKLFVDYDLNGGHTIMGNSIIQTDVVLTSSHRVPPLCPVSLNANYMFRDGYTLTSYNTSPDGMGSFIGIGSKINYDLFENKYVKLYCQWEKWTDSSYFEYTVNDDNEATIVKLNSADSFSSIVIPDSIDGHVVKYIAKGALTNASNSVELVLNYSLNTIFEDAMDSNNSLKKLVFFSSINKIYDKSFNSESLQTILIVKNTFPIDYANVGWLNISDSADFIYHYQKDPRPKVILIGHSTILYNHNLQPFKDKWGDRYLFYKYCGTAGVDTILLLYTLLPLLTENDYIFIPWYHSTLTTGNYVNMKNFAYFQYDFDCFLSVNYQLVKSFFFKSFLLYREYTIESLQSVVYSCEIMPTASNKDEFGGQKSGENCDDPNNSNGTYDFSIASYVNPSRYQYVKDYLKLVPFELSHVLITWNSYNQNNIRSDASRQSFINFENMIRESFAECTYFDSIEENILPGDHFLKNDMTHLSPRGGEIRVARWVNEIETFNN